MNRSYSLIAAFVTSAVITASPLAGELNTDVDNTLNVFVSGTTAVAADVNENFAEVADAVNDNNARIDANTAAITTNTTSITGLQTNKLNSADLGAALDTATTTSGNTVDGNAADILINSTAIGIHTTAISTNAANIADNAADITANTAAIIVNSADIDTNETNIAANTTAIAGKLSTSALGTALDSTTTTAGNSIDGNATDIASNTAAIALKADATDVATNATAIQDLQQHANRSSLACAGNDPDDLMVRVGPLCVDVYEASLWDTATGGNAIDASTCSDAGNDCSGGVTNIYARSVANTAPDATITWFQALQACANSGKRLLSNAEWQMAAAGTPDPGSTVDTANNCNTNSGAAVTTGLSAGGTNTCISNWGTFDMIGNLNEWTADWMHGANGSLWDPSTSTAGSGYGDDLMSGTNPAANQGTNSSGFPAAIYRGGAYAGGSGAGVFSVVSNAAPSFKGANVGFRCAR